MNKNTLLTIIVTIALTWFLVWFFSNDTDINKQLKESEETRKELVIDNERLQQLNDSLKGVAKAIIKNYNHISKKSKSKDDEIKESSNYIYNLNERQIDSAIRQHTHKSYIE